MTSFVYSPLDRLTNEIRLLSIKPDKTTSTELHCELKHLPLDSSLEFSALSYVWGEEPATCSIFINGSKVDIKPNLYAALREILPASPSLLLWCDALGINQEDLDERSYEVLRMKDIYKGATSVIVWLGSGNARSDLAMQHMRKWGDVLRYHGDRLSQLLCRSDFKAKMFRPDIWEATAELFARSWWERVWVLQEVALSRNAVLMCGAEPCGWTTFFYAISVWKMILGPDLVRFLSMEELGMVVKNENRVGELTIFLREQFAMPETKLSLLDLLRKVRHLKATDGRDKLYALLGLESIFDVSVVPNYRDSVAKVYTDFTQAFIRDKRSLSILQMAGACERKRAADLPSWVPDLRASFGSNGVSFATRAFAASGKTSAKCDFSNDMQTLSTRGVLCGSITRSEAPEPNDKGPRVAWAALVLSQGRKLYPTGIPVLQAYFRSLICDDSNQALRPKQFKDRIQAKRFYTLAAAFLFMLGFIMEQRDGFKHSVSREQLEQLSGLADYARSYARWERGSYHPLSEERVLESFLGSTESESRLRWPKFTDRRMGQNGLLLLASESSLGVSKKHLLITEEGYIGLGPSTTMSGDLLCIVLGCEVPLIIRPQGQQYVVIGSCYIYGMMHGEMIRKVQTGELYLQKLDFV